MADADTGFGGLINIRHTVRGYEEAGVQAIQLEDQESPKKCGHTPNRRVVSQADAVKRIDVAVAARRSSDTLIIARTDARTGLGLSEAIERGKMFAKA
jgi:2-methylisocitrate lyase-like PEP mutase family enzyme